MKLNSQCTQLMQDCDIELIPFCVSIWDFPGGFHTTIRTFADSSHKQESAIGCGGLIRMQLTAG